MMRALALSVVAAAVAAAAAACAPASPSPKPAPAAPAASAAPAPPEALPEDTAAKITKACFSDNDPAACVALATFFHEGMFGYQKDPKRAEELLARSRALQKAQCERGDAEQCALLGGLLAIRLRRLPEGDPEVKPLSEVVIGLLERGCRGGEGSACDALGEIHERGRGVTPDPARAKDLYARACDLGASIGCGSLADVLRRAGDAAGATRAYVRGCEAGLADAERHKDIPPPSKRLVPGPPPWTELCHAAGYLIATGEGAPADARRAADYYQHACDGGNPAACTDLGKLRGRAGPARPTTIEGPAGKMPSPGAW